MANREPKVLDNKVLRKVLLRYVMSRQTCFNYETMQSGPWVWSMLPAMQELYSDDEIAKELQNGNQSDRRTESKNSENNRYL